MTVAEFITTVADTLCGYPLFIALIGGGLFLFLYSGMISLRRLPAALRVIREQQSVGKGEISSLQALASVAGATVGMGNIAGVAIALVMGGPGAIFWMWISAIIGMSTKYHEGVLAVKYRSHDAEGNPLGGTMHIIRNGLSRQWRFMASFFAVAGMFGTLCIMNANQLTEATLNTASEFINIQNITLAKTSIGIIIALIVGLVVLGGIKRIATVASVIVPFMVTTYFVMVSYIIVTNLEQVPGVIASIFNEAFSLRAGWGALAGVALIGARRAALVNDAGIGTASIMHGSSASREPVKEGLVAMLCPALDSGFVCTLTALAILLCYPLGQHAEGLQGLTIALQAFDNGIAGGRYMLMAVVACFALSSMFSYSFYGRRCASYIFGERGARVYNWLFILSLVLFAVIPLQAAVGLCDLFYALMAFPTMLTLLMLGSQVKKETRRYFTTDKINLPKTIDIQPTQGI